MDEGKECRGSYKKVPECPEQFLASSVSCFVVVIAMLPISFSLSVSFSMLGQGRGQEGSGATRQSMATWVLLSGEEAGG